MAASFEGEIRIATFTKRRISQRWEQLTSEFLSENCQKIQAQLAVEQRSTFILVDLTMFYYDESWPLEPYDYPKPIAQLYTTSNLEFFLSLSSVNRLTCGLVNHTHAITLSVNCESHILSQRIVAIQNGQLRTMFWEQINFPCVVAYINLICRQIVF